VVTVWPDFRRSQAHEGLIDWFEPGQDGVGWSRGKQSGPPVTSSVSVLAAGV
jgi:hypothetical protein